jgi:hypothetical protein
LRENFDMAHLIAEMEFCHYTYNALYAQRSLLATHMLMREKVTKHEAKCMFGAIESGQAFGDRTFLLSYSWRRI